MPTGRFKAGTGPVAQPADLIVEQVKATWPDEPIRIRLQPQVYFPKQMDDTVQRRNGMFMAWKGLYWGWTVDTVEEARGLRRVLTLALRLMTEVGPDEVLRRLTVDTANGAGVESAVDVNEHTNTVS